MSGDSDMAAELAPYRHYPIERGFEYPTQEVAISAAEQRRLHGYCDIGPQVFGALADASLVSRLPIVMLSNTVVVQRPEWGQVHTVQRITQTRAIRLGETLTMYGRIEGCEPHPRGEVMTSSWRYVDASDQIVFVVRPDVLLISPTGSQHERGNSTPSPRETTVPLWQKTCTPEKTVGYCEGTFNPIHDNPGIAAEFGFRAPIIAGTQTMSYLLEPLYREQERQQIGVEIAFRRPVFWDDVLSIEGRRTGDDFAYICALNGAGKLVADCRVDESIAA